MAKREVPPEMATRIVAPTVQYWKAICDDAEWTYDMVDGEMAIRVTMERHDESRGKPPDWVTDIEDWQDYISEWHEGGVFWNEFIRQWKLLQGASV